MRFLGLRFLSVCGLAFFAQEALAETPICAGCHQNKWETYRRTGMGRAFYKPTPQTMTEDFTRGTYFHAASDSYFQMIRRGSEYFQRRYQLDPAGKPVNVMEKRIDYVMGSGNHARAYLHRTPNGMLWEMPLGWYQEKGGYFAMSPGYDRPDHDGFRRPIAYDCMFCHNAYPRIPAGHEEPTAPPVYEGALPEGIDCERCHGNGARHVQLAGKRARREDVRAAIVNPSRLSVDRQMEICMACHLETTSFPLPNAVQRYDRGPFSFQPGEPLGDFILNFDHAPGTGHDDKYEIVNSVYRLRKSACFTKSNGKLLCTTCHDPHDVPRGEAADRHYTAVCRQCHGGEHARKQTACIDCHMPKRRTEDVVHSAATDHAIPRLKPPGDLLAARPERHENYRGPVALYYPDKLPPTPENELYVAVAQVKQNSNLKAGIPQLQAAIEKHKPERPEFYIDLAEALERVRQPAVAWYREAVRRNPKLTPAARKLGTALRRAGESAESLEVLARVTSKAPSDAIAWHELGQTYKALGRDDDAIAATRKAIEHDPDMPEAHNNLGILLLARGHAPEAEQSFREAVRIKPDYADARGNLANTLAAAKRFDEARVHFEAALRSRPSDAATRYNYALLLGRAGRYDDAERQLEAAVEADRDFADAHLVLGDLLAAKKQWPRAVAQYREALRTQPQSARAHFSLGAALAASGDLPGAIPHLEKAAASGDARAAALLKQLKGR